jgi:hypothetical protein
MKQALAWTLDNLGRDVIDDDIDPQALNTRIEAAREADLALKNGQKRAAHMALRRFWG